MTEIRMIYNAITYPHLEAWAWHIAIYLFLGGLVAVEFVIVGDWILRPWRAAWAL